MVSKTARGLSRWTLRCGSMRRVLASLPSSLFGSLFASLLAGGLATPVVADPIAELDDAQARAQYAFYTADARALEDVAAVTERLEVPDSLAPLKAYNAAYARWKLAELYDEAADRSNTRAARALATKAAQACLSHTKNTLLTDAKMVEIYVVDAACSTLARTSRAAEVRALVPPCARSRSFRTALEIAPDNPRVMLMADLCPLSAAPTSVDRLRATLAAFDAAPPSRPGYPDWGQAEALLVLGQYYLQQGDARAARDVIEKALVIAPDYRKARELLDTVAVRPR